MLVAGCAQIVAPTGGPKDTTPPKPVGFKPENKSTLFTGHKIDITFNEFIQLKDINSQLVVSPPLKYFPATKIKKGKTLEIELKDTLLDNTTYTFNFGNSVCDLNEGNVLKNFHYVFSTGSYVDSLLVSGQLLDAFTLAPMKDGLVMLYSDQSDSAPYKKLPSYCGHSDANGFYQIENVKPGTYRIVGLSKSQGDYFYRPYTESMGFSSKPLDIQRNDTANLYLFAEEEPKVHMLKAKALEKGKILLTFNKPVDSLSVKPLNLPNGLATPPYSFISYSVTRDSAVYWINCPNLDSLKFIVLKNNKPLDTASIYSFPGTTNKKVTKPVPLKVMVNIADKQLDYDYHKPIVLTSDQPLANYDAKKIYLLQGKDTLHYKIDTSKLPFRLMLNTTLISDSGYRLFVTPGAFTSVFGRVNDTLNLHFKIVEPIHFGSLKLNVKFPQKGNYIVQILDGKSNVYRQNVVNGTKTIMYDALDPGTYRLCVIQDDNGDGKWTTGNYLKGIQPEKVFYFLQSITIRSNWDLTQDWLVR
jgi:uncharacterized protein (DUF2141 family)